MFLGEYEYIIDEKSRVFIPSKFRKIIKIQKQKILIITKGFEECLSVYPLKEWDNFVAKLTETLPSFKKDVRKVRRTIFASANEVKLDAQGRIPIPLNLRNYAQIKKEIIIIGNFNRIEIWDKAIWQKYSEEATTQYTDLADKIVEL